MWQMKKLCWISLLSDWILPRNGISLYFRPTCRALLITLDHHLFKPPPKIRPIRWERKGRLVYDHSKSKFPTTITRIERGLMTWSDWMAHMGFDSTALNTTTVIFHIHYFYSTCCPISLQGIIVCNARNRLLSSRGIDKSLMVLVTSLIRLFNYTMLIRQN